MRRIRLSPYLSSAVRYWTRTAEMSCTSYLPLLWRRQAEQPSGQIRGSLPGVRSTRERPRGAVGLFGHACGAEQQGPVERPRSCQTPISLIH
ncbi:hypothetical protein AAFF_G00105250 [Aldrovandia affinis]|uniref:Uncharacterized protein n=1 Tax=Aldrovandia affinis TaxID=143900 RepID=A0AAD7T247_9TELE|nr:hypothetical protein AAFF_G00105250 [Aldrovandia affinis]